MPALRVPLRLPLGVSGHDEVVALREQWQGQLDDGVLREGPFGVPVGDVPDLDSVVATSYRLLRMNRDHPEQSTTGQTGRGREREHWVYGRGGESCMRCGTTISRGEQGEPPRARVTFWCPSCQPTP